MMETLMKWVMLTSSLTFLSQVYKILGPRGEIIEVMLLDPFRILVKSNKICIIIQTTAEGILLMKLTLLFNIMPSLTWR